MKKPNTEYRLEKYLKGRKDDTDKAPRAPSGFRKKPLKKESNEEERVKRQP